MLRVGRVLGLGDAAGVGVAVVAGVATETATVQIDRLT